MFNLFGATITPFIFGVYNNVFSFTIMNVDYKEYNSSLFSFMILRDGRCFLDVLYLKFFFIKIFE